MGKLKQFRPGTFVGCGIHQSRFRVRRGTDGEVGEHLGGVGRFPFGEFAEPAGREYRHAWVSELGDRHDLRFALGVLKNHRGFNKQGVYLRPRWNPALPVVERAEEASHKAIQGGDFHGGRGTSLG